MLIHILFFMFSLVILFFILAVKDDNMVYAVITVIFGSITTLFWGQGIEMPHAKYVVENAAAENIENIGTWVSTYQEYSPHGATIYLPAIFAIFGMIVLIYLASENFRGSVE